MLAHKVDGENPVTYSEFLLAAWKLERWAEARDPVPPETNNIKGSNITHSHSQGKSISILEIEG